ncbi:MAG TPA: hypothetical protein VEL28_22730 [Candidatus Binatia bacterium]|nr:hypothetical protein [Candidatus Binatia bacterium]
MLTLECPDLPLLVARLHVGRRPRPVGRRCRSGKIGSAHGLGGDRFDGFPRRDSRTIDAGCQLIGRAPELADAPRTANRPADELIVSRAGLLLCSAKVLALDLAGWCVNGGLRVHRIRARRRPLRSRTRLQRGFELASREIARKCQDFDLILRGSDRSDQPGLRPIDGTAAERCVRMRQHIQRIGDAYHLLECSRAGAEALGRIVTKTREAEMIPLPLSTKRRRKARNSVLASSIRCGDQAGLPVERQCLADGRIVPSLRAGCLIDLPIRVAPRRRPCIAATAIACAPRKAIEGRRCAGRQLNVRALH